MKKRLAAGLAVAGLSTAALAGLAAPASAAVYSVRCLDGNAHIYGPDGTYYGSITDSNQC